VQECTGCPPHPDHVTFSAGEGWKDADYDVSGWESASEHTEEEVGTKDGYEEIDWSSDARIIWTSDLEQDNTLLCKVTVQAP